jgi:cytochrome c-type biogenesis protein CcmH/NrfG
VESKRRQPAAAVEALGKATKLDPKNPTVAADYCRAQVDLDPVGDAGPKACRAALGLAGDSPLARYMLGKSLVARGDCAAAKTEVDRFLALPAVKPDAKAGARKLLESCTAGKPASPVHKQP